MVPACPSERRPAARGACPWGPGIEGKPDGKHPWPRSFYRVGTASQVVGADALSQNVDVRQRALRSRAVKPTT